MKILVYTFRTFPNLSKLEEIFGEVFIFGKLKEDLAKFTELIKAKKPDLVLGIASERVSRVEQVAVNKFNTGLIDPAGPNEVRLYVPMALELPLSKKETSTFCNWTMYKVGKYLLEQKAETKFSFIHVNPSDLSRLDNLL